jgi:pimeloyl-ACP methyl ester carboxylesterase
MFARHGISAVSLVAHSYGTFYASCLLKLARDKVRGVGGGVCASCELQPAACVLLLPRPPADAVLHPLCHTHSTTLGEQRKTKQVSSVALIDPVCCCMWSGHLISNFVYSPARSTTGAVGGARSSSGSAR